MTLVRRFFLALATLTVIINEGLAERLSKELSKELSEGLAKGLAEVLSEGLPVGLQCYLGDGAGNSFGDSTCSTGETLCSYKKITTNGALVKSEIGCAVAGGQIQSVSVLCVQL